MLRLLPVFVWLPALFAQDFSKIQIEKIAANLRFTEGPVWSREGYLLFTDAPTNRILMWVPGRGLGTARDNSGGANGLAMDAQGRLYACEHRNRRVTRSDSAGKVEVLADRWEGKRLNAPNDIVVRRDGNVYFTDPAFGADQTDTRELDFYGIYHIPPKGELELVAKPAGRPNGVALSPNGRTLYVVNSDERNVRTYDLDRSGKASNERVLIAKTDGVPNGVRVDDKGNLYVTCRGLAVYTPQGKLVHVIPIPERPSNCAFGDGDFQTLYVTAQTSVYRVRLDVKGSVQY
jgi:gluconolactonase